MAHQRCRTWRRAGTSAVTRRGCGDWWILEVWLQGQSDVLAGVEVVVLSVDSCCSG